MPTLTFLQGLPGSGKSTWAREQVSKNPHGTVRINNDDLRESLNDGVFGKNNEKQISKVRNILVDNYLCNGYNVILDNTNLNPIHEEEWRTYCKGAGFQFVKKFFDVDVEECIKRDSQRSKPVGDKVIREMYEKYLKPQKKSEFERIKMNYGLPHVIVVDIDGTIADKGERSGYDYSKVSDDTPIEDVIGLILDLEPLYDVVFVSGRSDICREDSEKWLKKAFHFPIKLHMRKEGDRRKDDIVKYEILRDELVPKYYVKYWFDDRDRVVKAIREAGVRVLQVADGNF